MLAVSFSPYNSITPDLVSPARESATRASSRSPTARSARWSSCRDIWVEVIESDFAGFRSLAATLAVGMALVHGVARSAPHEAKLARLTAGEFAFHILENRNFVPGGTQWRLRLDGKVALVTGATQGIGRAIAEAAARSGAAGLLLTGRDAERGDAVAGALLGRGAPRPSSSQPILPTRPRRRRLVADVPRPLRPHRRSWSTPPA